jgi:hypothetical protein
MTHIENAASVPGVTWVKSSASGQNGNCVEVGQGLAPAVPVRDSKDPEGPALVFPADAFGAFLGAVKAGQLNH